MNLRNYLPPCKQPVLCYQYSMSIWSVSHNRETNLCSQNSGSFSSTLFFTFWPCISSPSEAHLQCKCDAQSTVFRGGWTCWHHSQRLQADGQLSSPPAPTFCCRLHLPYINTASCRQPICMRF